MYVHTLSVLFLGVYWETLTRFLIWRIWYRSPIELNACTCMVVSIQIAKFKVRLTQTQIPNGELFHQI